MNISIPIKLERIEKPDEDQAIYFEAEQLAAAKGGKLASKEMTLNELLYNTSSDEMLSIKQVLENG